jgi:thiaminase/transcriptional activator TenA
LQGDFLDLMAALAPCVMGYGEIGVRLAAEKSADTLYAAWIDTYANSDYQAVCTTVGTMIDAAVIRRIGDLATSPRAQALQNRFTRATLLEVGFWQMGLNAS